MVVANEAINGQGLGFTREPGAEMHHKPQALVAVGVLDHDQLLAHRHRDRQLLGQLPLDRGGDRFAFLLLAAREFPQAAQQPLVEPLIDQDPAGAIEHHPHPDHLERHGAGGVLHGVAGGIAGSVGSAVPPPGTGAAAGRTGGADAGAQIHQSLVERSGPPGIEQQLAQLPEPGQLPRRWPRTGDQARQHPFDIAIKNRRWRIEGRRQDAGGGAAAQPRQGLPALEAAGPQIRSIRT